MGSAGVGFGWKRVEDAGDGDERGREGGGDSGVKLARARGGDGEGEKGC